LPFINDYLGNEFNCLLKETGFAFKEALMTTDGNFDKLNKNMHELSLTPRKIKNLIKEDSERDDSLVRYFEHKQKRERSHLSLKSAHPTETNIGECPDSPKKKKILSDSPTLKPLQSRHRRTHSDTNSVEVYVVPRIRDSKCPVCDTPNENSESQCKKCGEYTKKNGIAKRIQAIKTRSSRKPNQEQSQNLDLSEKPLHVRSTRVLSQQTSTLKKPRTPELKRTSQPDNVSHSQKKELSESFSPKRPNNTETHPISHHPPDSPSPSPAPSVNNSPSSPPNSLPKLVMHDQYTSMGDWVCPSCISINMPTATRCVICESTPHDGLENDARSAEWNAIIKAPVPSPKKQNEWQCQICDTMNSFLEKQCNVCGWKRQG